MSWFVCRGDLGKLEGEITGWNSTRTLIGVDTRLKTSAGDRAQPASCILLQD